MIIPTEIVPSVSRASMSTRAVAEEFQALLDSKATMQVAGTAKRDHDLLEAKPLVPRYKIELFGVKFYLTNVIQIPELRFFVAYVVLSSRNGKQQIYPRIFYKDLSLAWRSASHFAYEDDGDLWIGKGDVRYTRQNGHLMANSIEATTDLPIEMQSAMESLLGRATKVSTDGERVLKMVLRQGPSHRVEPYSDFVRPREKAASEPKNLINQGRAIARFKRRNVPDTLVFTKGFAPDFHEGVIERSKSKSRLYGGQLKRFRILSLNRKIQFYFYSGPKHVWLMPPQALTTQLSSYGVRTIDVVADDELFVPGYEYHHDVETESGTELYSQIPDGFAGDVCPHDDVKADASPWLDRIPVIQKFRTIVLNR